MTSNDETFSDYNTSRTVVLAHGIRQINAKTHMRPLAESLDNRGIQTRYANYGYILIPTSNDRAVEAVMETARDGDDVAAYSNGAWGAVQAAEQGRHVRHLYLISPALNTDTEFPENIDRITVWYTPSDGITVLGKWWRKITRILPWRWRNPHGWGEMGTKGPQTDDPRVAAIHYDPEDVGHDWFNHPAVVAGIAMYIEDTVEDAV